MNNIWNLQVGDIIQFTNHLNFKVRISDKDTEGITLEEYKNK
jgi:flagellar motor switch protein FliM